MRLSIPRWSQLCQPCQRSKVSRHNKAILSRYSPTRFQHINVDIVGRLPTVEGCQYLCTIIDRFTRWPVAIPMVDSRAETVADVIIRQCVLAPSGKWIEAECYLSQNMDKIRRRCFCGLPEEEILLNCQQNCGATYIGQSRRRIEVRKKEHLANYRKGEFGKSSFADHLMERGHWVDSSCQELVMGVHRADQLNIHEWMAIALEKRRNTIEVLNSDHGPVDTIFTRLLWTSKQPVGRRIFIEASFRNFWQFSEKKQKSTNFIAVAAIRARPPIDFSCFPRWYETRSKYWKNCTREARKRTITRSLQRARRSETEEGVSYKWRFVAYSNCYSNSMWPRVTTTTTTTIN